VAPSISGDGRRIAYNRYGRQRPYDVYLWERGRAESRRVTHGNASSTWPDISADGKWLVFTSSASDLVPDDRNPNKDVFIWDTRSHPRDVQRLTHGISRSTYATVSSDGRIVALVSTGPPVKGNVSNPHFGVYLRDRTTGTTRRITLASAEVMTAEISDNGNHVVYRLRRSSPSPIPGSLQIWDRNTGTTTMLPASPPPQDPRVSAEGRQVVYQGADPDPIYPTDVYLWNRLD
jgi:Tol biopolymer transport system component